MVLIALDLMVIIINYSPESSNCPSNQSEQPVLILTLKQYFIWTTQLLQG